VRVYGFVVNCGDDLEEAREWPVDGVMTDDPRLFAKTPWLKPEGPVVLP
jgi:glycerophosphoryl diester phosphodiesterase